MRRLFRSIQDWGTVLSRNRLFHETNGNKKSISDAFLGNYDVCSRLMLEECTKDYQDKIVKIEREGQTFLCR